MIRFGAKPVSGNLLFTNGSATIANLKRASSNPLFSLTPVVLLIEVVPQTNNWYAFVGRGSPAFTVMVTV